MTKSCGHSFESDWLKVQHKVSGPIMQQSKKKAISKHSRITFTNLKSSPEEGALLVNLVRYFHLPYALSLFYFLLELQVDILTGTPGKLDDFISTNKVSLSQVNIPTSLLEKYFVFTFYIYCIVQCSLGVTYEKNLFTFSGEKLPWLYTDSLIRVAQ